MSDILNTIKSLPDISFIDNLKLEELLSDMINDYQNKYEELTGVKITLAKADPNRLILYACAVQLYQGFQHIDRAGKQNLLKYSYGNFLDNIAALKGVTRNKAKPAEVKVQFTLSEARPAATPIPLGTKVVAGNVYFESIEYKEIPSGEISVDVAMICTKEGESGNGLLIGEITTLVDPIAYVETVSNIVISSGGSEIETDESLAERTFLAPSSYSTAGPDDAYIYWTKTFNNDIIDVGIESPSACLVDIRVVLKGGALPGPSFLQGLHTYLTNKKIKPLTDLVTVAAPDEVNYDIDITYWINKSDSGNAVAIQSKVNLAVSEYRVWQENKIGRDINPSELTRRVMAAGAKRVEINTPVYTVVKDNTAVARLVSQSVIYGGLE